MHKQPKGMLQGKKISNKHQTVIPAAMSFVRTVRKIEEVRKVVIGPVRAARRRGASAHVKVAAIDAGLRVTVCGPSSAQEFFLYTHYPDAVLRKLSK